MRCGWREPVHQMDIPYIIYVEDWGSGEAQTG